MSLTINEAIANLYQTFESYPLDIHMDCCPCCIDEHDKKNLMSYPLRELTDLNKYSHKSLTTWGNEQDFKHFLPRIFELLVIYDGKRSTNLETIFGKLSDGNWNTWPITEQEAIRDYFRAGWIYALEQITLDNGPVTWLCGIGIANEDLQPYLNHWINVCSVNAYEHLANFVEGEIDYYSKKRRLSNAFWDNAPKAHAQVLEWLFNPLTREQLETIFFKNSSTNFASTLSRAIQILEWFVFSQRA